MATPTAAPRGRPAPEDFKLEITTASAQFLVDERLLIFGPPKHGKTWAAMTLSDYWPEGDPLLNRKKIKLEDTLLVSLDGKGAAGLNEVHVDVDVLDLSPYLTPKHLLKMLDKLQEDLTTQVAKGKKNILIDPINELDFAVNHYWVNNGGETKGYDLFRAMLATHKQFGLMVQSLRCTVPIICHAKMPSDDNDAANKRKAMSLPENFTSSIIEPDLTGSIKNFYKGISTMILPVFMSKNVKTGKMERNAYPFGSGPWIGGSRYQKFLDEVEPANLRAIYDKIRNGIKQEQADSLGT